MSRTKKKRIGIFGGTFNPPHIGHLIAAERVCEVLQLDKIYFVPSFVSPHKRAGEEALAKHRLAMVDLAIRINNKFEVSSVEVAAMETSYTYKTVESFRKRFPGSELYFIIGMDNYIEFSAWKYPERIKKSATIVVVNRATEKASRKRSRSAKSVRFVNIPGIGISSSDIRERVKNKQSIRYLVPEAVKRYILRKKLYQ